ncbi:phage adaptor protein [Methylobacterium sp. Leaf85]|uniref:phage adaptor protein n=1 Tax=Methylobacterium sp. Leaf85 TaxID=1736241 RepID=UPI0006FC4AF0|nr:hypothetical protein [Methylobacterium sp. Leaf85]KQO43027.1 hypothetical protein ASF08_10645 [Methylobacterium sp. Leaf85]
MALPPITDYDSLVLNVSDYIARNDLEDYYPTFIQLTENRLNSALKVPGMETETTLTLSADGTVATPSAYVEWILVSWRSAPTARAQRLRYVEANSPEFTHRHRPNGSAQYYTVAGNKIRLAPARAGTIETVFYQRVPPLTSAAPTNWLITKAPQLYLYGVLAEAYSFQKDEVRSAEWGKAADERLKLFIEESSAAKVGRRAERNAEVEAEVIAAKAPN